MAELLRTTDMVLLSYVNFLLSDAGIPVLVADAHVSTVEGSIGAFPRRVLIASEDWDESAAILTDAGLAAHLAPPPREAARRVRARYSRSCSNDLGRLAPALPDPTTKLAELPGARNSLLMLVSRDA